MASTNETKKPGKPSTKTEAPKKGEVSEKDMEKASGGFMGPKPGKL